MLDDPDTDDDVELFRGKGEFEDAGLTDRVMGKVAAVCVICLYCCREINRLQMCPGFKKDLAETSGAAASFQTLLPLTTSSDPPRRRVRRSWEMVNPV